MSSKFMTKACDNGMDWLTEDVPSADAKSDALKAVGRVAQMSVFSVLRASFDDAHKRSGLSRRSLAKKLNVSSAMVSKILREPSNLTVDTAARILFVLGHEFRIYDPLIQRKRPEDSFVHWQTPAVVPAPIFQATVTHGRCEISADTVQDVASVYMMDEVDGPEIWVSGYGRSDGVYQPVTSAIRAKSTRRKLPMRHSLSHVDA